tara:strand:- start:362 stop:661 length:300 start_codon:yes stop_codon:yes gene_type:complete
VAQPPIAKSLILCNDTIMNKTTDMIPTEQQAKWDDIMGQMCVFVNDTNADIDMAYDWVCEMLNISSFVDNETAWNSFYDVWESCDNRKDRPFFHEYNFA